MRRVFLVWSGVCADAWRRWRRLRQEWRAVRGRWHRWRRAPAGTEAESETLAPGTGGIGGRWLLGPGEWCIIKIDV